MRHLTPARVLLLLLALPATVAAAGLLAPGSLAAARGYRPGEPLRRQWTLVALAVAGYSWLAAVDAYAAGMPVDYGWMVGYALIAAGAVAALRSKRD